MPREQEACTADGWPSVMKAFLLQPLLSLSRLGADAAGPGIPAGMLAGTAFSLGSVIRFFRHPGARKARDNDQILLSSSHGLGIHDLILDEDGRVVDYVTVDANKSFTEITGLDLDTPVAPLTPASPNPPPLALDVLTKSIESQTAVSVCATFPLTGRTVDITVIPLDSRRCVSFLFDRAQPSSGRDSSYLSDASCSSIIRDAPIAIWEEDWSLVRAYCENLLRSGVEDLMQYFAAHPEETVRCESLIRVVAGNEASEPFRGTAWRSATIQSTGIRSRSRWYRRLADEVHAMIHRMDSFSASRHYETELGMVRAVAFHVRPGPESQHALDRVFVSVVEIPGGDLSTVPAGPHERDYQAIFECVASPALVLDEYTTILAANGEAARLLGMTQDEIEGVKRLVDFVSKEDLPNIWEFYHLLRANPDASRSACNCQFILGDESTREIRLIAAQLHTTPWTVVTLQDLTKSHEAERTIQKSEERLRQLAETVDEVFWILSPDYTELYYVNSTYETVLNRTKESLFDDPMSWVMALHPDDQESARSAMQRIRAGSTVECSDDEFRLTKPDGSQGWIWIRTKPVFDANGRITARACVITDITKSKHVELALNRRLEEQMVLHTVAMTSASATSIDSLIEHATLDIGTVLYPDNFGIMLMDESDDVLRIHPSYRGVDDALRGQSIQPGRGVPYRVVATGQPCRVPDVAVDPAYRQLTAGMRSELCVPLKVGERVIGVINAESKRRAAFTQADERLMMTFAGQLATAIAKIRLLETEHQRVEALEALRTTMTDISAELESERLLQTIVERAVDLVGAAGGQLGLTEEDSDEIRIVVCYNMDQRCIGKALKLGEGAMGRSAQTCVPLIVADYQTWEGRSEKFTETPSRGVLAAPLLAGRQLVGVISVNDTDPARRFSASDLRLLNMFAQQAAIAVENARLFREIQHLAITDPLTGLFNRRYFFDLAQREVDRTRRYNRPLAVLMLDLDHFKQVNDIYGHAAGDEVLRTVGNRLGQVLRKTDVLGRYGGEEFAILLPETAHAGATLVADKLRERINDRPIATQHALITMTASVGIGFYDESCKDLDELMDRADQAMYEAKRTGRDRICVWRPIGQDSETGVRG